MRLGRAALELGQMAAARAAWQAAGHWAELLPLCALQADLATLRTLLASVRPPECCCALKAVRIHSATAGF